MYYEINFVIAPDDKLRKANEILRSQLTCAPDLRLTIRAVAKAFIDENDEIKRFLHDAKTNAPKMQLAILSPREMIEKAKTLRSVQFDDAETQEKVRAVAKSYVVVAEKNQEIVDAFNRKYRDKLPPGAS